jgi:rRNA processing protein Gar1
LLGTVDEITCDGKAVVRTLELPEIGGAVFNAGGKKIGNVKRVFGPVDGPYASVLLDEGVRSEGLKNTDLYVRGTQNGKSKRRNRRD